MKLEHTYAAVPYCVIDAIIECSFSKSQLCILLALVRRTDGMRGQTARLSTSLLAHYAGMRAVSDSKRASGAFRQALRELVDSGVVLEPERGVFAIERDFTRWRELGELNKPGRASGSREQAAGMSERLAAS